MPQGLSQPTLHLIADDRPANLCRHRQAHAYRPVSRPVAGSERSLGEPLPRGLDREELRTTQKPGLLWETKPAPRHANYFCAARTTSRFRPLARRRLSIFRPAGVALRLRNPCSLFRRTLLG
jgi:hypothetical protein